MKRIFFTFVFIALAACAMAGTKEDIEQVQRNVLDLQQQFWNLQKDLKENSAALQGSVTKIQNSAQDMQTSQAALSAKLETILNQIQALSEKLDDTNRRVKELSTRQMPPSMMPADAGGMTPSQPGTEPTAQPSVGEQQLFQSANAEYSKGNFEQALRGFQDLIDQYPNSSSLDGAQYMIGQCFYSMKEYVDAVTEFDKVIKQYPDSENVPGARLKKGLSLFALGKKGQAVVEFQQLVQRYPNSKEAQIARQRLAELGLD